MAATIATTMITSAATVMTGGSIMTATTAASLVTTTKDAPQGGTGDARPRPQGDDIDKGRNKHDDF
jgi:hypothetical protein